MNEQEIKNLLRQADRTANKPAWAGVNINDIRHQAGRRRIIKVILPPAIAAVLLMAVSIWIICAKSNNRIHQTEKIASIEARIEKLQASTNSAINLIQEVLEEQRRQKQLDELNARLASIPDPLEEIQKQVDKTAFILVYQADRMYRELNETDSAVETYKRVIKLFPENQWAQVARERLDEIERKSKNNSSKGDSKWKSQST